MWLSWFCEELIKCYWEPHDPIKRIYKSINGIKKENSNQIYFIWLFCGSCARLQLSIRLECEWGPHWALDLPLEPCDCKAERQECKSKQINVCSSCHSCLLLNNGSCWFHPVSAITQRSRDSSADSPNTWIMILHKLMTPVASFAQARLT